MRPEKPLIHLTQRGQPDGSLSDVFPTNLKVEDKSEIVCVGSLAEMNHSQFHAELHSMRHQHLCLVLDLECYSGEPLELDPGARSFQDQLLDNGNDASRPPYHCPIVKPADDDESQYAIGKLMLLDQETSELLSDMIKRHETLSFGCVIDRGLPLEEWQLKKVPIYVNVYCPSDTLEELDSVLQTLGINLEHPFHVPPGIQGPVPVRSGIKLREPKLVRDRRLGQLQYMVIQNLAPSEQFLDLDDRYKKSRDPKNSEFERRNIAQMLENDLEAILAPEFTGAM